MERVIVSLSGGQDSTTCLFWAKHRFPEAEIHAVTVNYGQRHRREILAAGKIAELAGVKSFEVIDVGTLLKSSSPLTDFSHSVGQYEDASLLPGGIEPTFVPARNILFLVILANRAIYLKAEHLVIGVSAVDYGGYPDCRPQFIDKMTEALAWGCATPLRIHAPLIYLSKEETVRLNMQLPGCMQALAYSHTCYRGEFPPCGKCHACLLREKGFHDAGIPDPQKQWETDPLIPLVVTGQGTSTKTFHPEDI